MTQSDGNKNQPPEEEEGAYGLKTPSGFISSEQISSLLESAAKSAGPNKHLKGPGPHKEFKSSGKNIDEPPSGFIPSGQISSLLESASQRPAKDQKHHQPKVSPPAGFQPSNKGIEEPPSGFIPSAQISSLLGANQSKEHRQHSGKQSDKAWSSQPLPGLRPPTQDSKPALRRAAESASAPLPIVPAKKGCFGVVLLPLFGLGAWCALHALL